MQMRLKKGLPEGILLVNDNLYPLVQKIHLLNDRDIRELNAFVDYLLEGPDMLSKAKNLKVAKIFDFMGAGMQKTG